MTCNTRHLKISLFTLVLAALLAAPAPAGDFTSQNTFGGSGFFASPACPAKKFPTFESLVPIPSIVDPFQQDLIPMFCEVQITREGEGVKRVKGKFESDLVVIDNNTGQAESFPVGSGTFKTDRNGRAGFDFDIPTELFADGFESGDVSAWSYTRSDFTNRKRATSTSTACQTGSSRSN